MDLAVVRRAMEHLFRQFRKGWPQPRVRVFLEQFGERLEESSERFEEWIDDVDVRGASRLRDGDESTEGGPTDGTPADSVTETPERETATDTPRVDSGANQFPELVGQLMQAHEDAGTPVVVETNPTYGALFGMLEQPREGHFPNLSAIRPGSLVRAQGGYLVLRVHDVLRDIGVWTLLKRALLTRQIEIRDYDQNTGQTGGLCQPAPIPTDVKVVLIGEPGVYEALAMEDPQFLQVFKIHAEFDSTVKATKPNLRRYADYIAWLCRSEGHRAFTPDAVAAIAEWGARVAGRKDRVIARFGEIADLAREASYWRVKAGAGPVTREHVDRAVEARTFRSDLPRELAERDYAAGYTRIETTGQVVGQINALTVLDSGVFQFGRPCRITASVGMAAPDRSGLVNIEGEAALSGPIYDKAVMILEGYLLRTFGEDGPLCIQSTVCFEQLYGGVEGDSASLAQVLCLLSSLSGVPLNQGLAVTGSIDQNGAVQAVAGVNEKIEGFFRLCESRRRPKSIQGAILPRANADDLMLEPVVIEASEAGRFEVHAVKTVDEALALLTGRPAKEVHAAARAALNQYRQQSGSRT